MEQDQHIWRGWASFLQHWGVQTWAAACLDGLGPVLLLGAQVVYMSQPLLRFALPEEQLDALARILEEPESTQSFVHYLREVE